MTLRVVADNTVELQVYNFQDIAGCARRFADQFEAGEQGEATRAVLIVQTDDGPAIHVWGECADTLQLIGLLEAAKMQAYANMIACDDD